MLYQRSNVLIAAIAHAKQILLKAQNMFWFESLNGHRLYLFLAFEIVRNCLNLLKRGRLDVVLFRVILLFYFGLNVIFSGL